MPQQNEDEEEEEETDTSEHIKNEIKQHEITEKRNKLHVSSINEIQDEKIKNTKRTKTFKRSNVIDATDAGRDERKYLIPKKNMICVSFIQIYSNGMMPSCSKYTKFDPLESYHATNDFQVTNDLRHGVGGVFERKQNDNRASVERWMKNVKHWSFEINVSEICHLYNIDGKDVQVLKIDESSNIGTFISVIWCCNRNIIFPDLNVLCNLRENFHKPFNKSQSEMRFCRKIFNNLISVIKYLHHKKCYPSSCYFMNYKLPIVIFSSINVSLKLSYVINFKEILNFTKTNRFINVINLSLCSLIISNNTNFYINLYYTFYCDSDYFSDNLLSNINLSLISATTKYSIISLRKSFFQKFIIALFLIIYILSCALFISKPSRNFNQCFKIHLFFCFHLMCSIFFIHETHSCVISKESRRNPASCIIHTLEINLSVSRECCTLFPTFVFKLLTILFSDMASNSISLSLWTLKNILLEQKIELMKYMNLKNNGEISPLFFPWETLSASLLYSMEDRITNPFYLCCSIQMELSNMTSIPLEIYPLRSRYYYKVKHYPFNAQCTTHSSEENESDFSHYDENNDNIEYVTKQESSEPSKETQKCVTNVEEKKTYRIRCKENHDKHVTHMKIIRYDSSIVENTLKNEDNKRSQKNKTIEDKSFDVEKQRRSRRKAERLIEKNQSTLKPFHVNFSVVNTLNAPNRIENNALSRLTNPKRTFLSNLMLIQIVLSMLPATLADEVLVSIKDSAFNTTTVPDVLTVSANASFIPWERNICDDYYRKHQQIVTGRSQDIALNLSHPQFLTSDGVHPGVTYQVHLRAINPQVFDLSLTSLIQNKPSGTLLGLSTHCVQVNSTVSSRIYERQTLTFNFSLSHTSVNAGLHNLTFRLRYRVRGTSQVMFETHLIFPISRDCEFKLWPNRGNVSWSDMGLSLYSNKWTNQCKLVFPNIASNNLTSESGLLIRLTRLYIPCNQGYLEFMNHTLPNNTARSSSPPHPSAPSKTPPGSTSKICGKLEEISETEREFYFSPNLIEYAPQLIITGECVFSLTYHFVDHCYNTSITKFNDSIVLYTSNKVLQCNFYILQQYGYRINLTILVWSKNETNEIPTFDNSTLLPGNDTLLPMSADSDCDGLLIRMTETGNTIGKCVGSNETAVNMNIVSRENKIQLKILARNFIHKWIQIIYETLAIEHIVHNCHLGSVAVRQFCLSVVDSIKLSWPEAESECVRRRGHLASIRSAYAQSMIDNMLLSSVYYSEDNAYWVGATDFAHEGDFRWTDSLSFSYSNWFPGWPQYGNYNKQPNDDGLSRQDCVELRRTYTLPPSISQALPSPRTTPTYMWNDRDCSTANYFICETAITTNLEVPDRKTTDCNRTIALSHEQPRALITSPGFPRPYPDNAKCNTLISALPGYRVVLHFEEFVFEPEPHCSYDYLIISEDNVTRRDNTRRLCGDWSDKLKLLRYVSKTAQVRLTFVSDYSHHYSGFKARISMEHVLMECADSRLHMFNTSCYLFVSYPQVTWHTASDICRGLEGELASIHSIEEHRFIVSKLRESKEYSTSAFYWMGGTLDRHNKWKWIDNTHMDFTAWLPKSSSYVVLDGQSSSCLSIQWMLSANPLHSSGLYWSPQRCQSVGGYVCKKENLENPVNANTSLVGTEGYITSPSFPSNYANNLDYLVKIRGPEETRIVLAFLRLDLEPQSECLYDYVEMFHSGSLTPPTRLCGNHHISELTQLNFVSENNEATLRFHSDYSVSASGFSIQWRAVDVSGCPIQLLTAREGVIYSPNYPHFLLAHLDCTFTVLAPAGRRVWLEIVDYNLEDVYDQNLLQEASLDISLGAGTPSFRPYVNRALLSDGAFLSFGERLELRLRTGASPSGRGFKANYKIVNSVTEERVVHLYNGTGIILRHLNFPAPPPGLSVMYNQRLVAPLGYCIQLVFYQTVPALCMDSLDSGSPECSQLSNGTSGSPSAYVQVKDSYAELNGTRWHLVEAQGGYAPPMTIVSYLNSIHVTQTSSPGSPYGMRLNISVSLRVDYNYKSKLLRGSSDTGVESCIPNPCQNGGKCFSNGAKSFCQCVGHYTGMLCALTMCELEPCLFGSCELTPIGYKCHCQEGYRGITCDLRIRPCDASPCNGHGMCVEKSDRRYQCRCYAWWRGENCSERILHIPQTPLAERMLQEPFWLGLITVTVVLLVLGLFWCARRHFPDKLEKLLAEENERNRHQYPSASSSRSHLSHSHHHCIHSHSCSHPIGGGHIPVPTTGAPPNSPHSSTRSLFTKIRRKASILSLTSPIIGGSSKKLSTQKGGPSSPRAFSLDDLVKSSISTARSRTPSPRKRRNNSTPTKNKMEAGEIFKKLSKKPSSDDSNIQETCFSVGSESDIARPLTLAACSADSILAMFRNFSSSLPSHGGGGVGAPRTSALVSATTSPTCTSPQISDESCTPYSSSSNLMESPTFGSRKPTISIQVPVMDQKSMNSSPGPTILLEVPSSNKGGLSPIHEVPTPALTPVMARHNMSSALSDNSDMSFSSGGNNSRRPHHLIIPMVTVESPSPTSSSSPKFLAPHLLGSPPPHRSRRCFSNRDFEPENLLSISQQGCGPPVITVTGTMSEAESDDTEVGGKGGGGGGGTSSEGTGGGGGMCYLSPYTLYSRGGATESGYSSMASPASSRCGSNNPLCPPEGDELHGGVVVPVGSLMHRRPSPLLRTCRVEDPEPGDHELSDDCTMSDNQSNDEGFATDHVEHPEATTSGKDIKELKNFLSPVTINLEDTSGGGLMPGKSVGGGLTAGGCVKKSLLQLPTIVIDAESGGFGGGSPVSSRSESPLSDKTCAGGLARFNPMYYGRLTDSDGLYDCPSPDCCKTSRKSACRKKMERRKGGGGDCRTLSGGSDRGGGGGTCRCGTKPSPKRRVRSHPHITSSSSSESISLQRHRPLKHLSASQVPSIPATLQKAADHFAAAEQDAEASSEDTSEDVASDILRDSHSSSRVKKGNRLRNFGQQIRLLARSSGESREATSVNIPLLGSNREKKDRHSCEEPLLGREREGKRTAIVSRTHTD